MRLRSINPPRMVRVRGRAWVAQLEDMLIGGAS